MIFVSVVIWRRRRRRCSVGMLLGGRCSCRWSERIVFKWSRCGFIKELFCTMGDYKIPRAHTKRIIAYGVRWIRNDAHFCHWQRMTVGIFISSFFFPPVPKKIKTCLQRQWLHAKIFESSSSCWKKKKLNVRKKLFCYNLAYAQGLVCGIAFNVQLLLFHSFFFFFTDSRFCLRVS